MYPSSSDTPAPHGRDLVLSDAIASDTQTLNRLRWRVSQLALVIASLAMVLQWLLLTLEPITYGAVSLLIASLWFALLAVYQGAVRRVSVLAERLGHLGSLALFLEFYTRTVANVLTLERPPGELAEIFPWFAPIYITAFIVYSGRTALALCGGVALYTSSVSAFFISRSALNGAEMVGLEASLDLFAANVISLLMLFMLRRTTEAWTKTRARAEALAQLANRDALTGLYNRRYLDQTVAEEVRRARRYEHPLSVALCDIDNFKHVNDRFSHGVGDSVLGEVARLLESSVRRIDTVARYGGEEFVLIFPETEAAQAHVVCEKVRRKIERHPWFRFHPELSVTVSIGVASARRGARYQNSKQLLSAADLKLYEAKRAGRNQVQR